MKLFKLAFLLFITISLTSCMSFYETIHFNEDGSGEYEMRLDAAQMVSSMEAFGSLGGMFGEDGTEDISGGLDSLMSVLDTMILDTLIRMADLPHEVIEELKDSNLENVELLENLSVHMLINKEEGTFEIAVQSTFDRYEDLTETMNLMKQARANMDMGEAGGLAEIIPIDSEESWVLKKNKLSRSDINIMDALTEGMGETELELGEESMGELGGFMSMFFGGSVYRTEITFPSKVKKVTLEDARIEGNKVIIEHKLEDLINDEEKDYSGYIKFKKTWK